MTKGGTLHMRQETSFTVSNEAAISQDDIDLVELLRRVLARKWLVLACSLFGLGCGILYLHLVTPTYSAELKVTPAATSSGSLSNKLGGLSGLAAMAGVSVGTPTGGATPFELYIDRLKSREIADELAKDPRIMRTVFDTEWDSAGHRWRQPASALRPIKEGVKAVLGVPSRPWRAPTGADLQIYLDRKLVITKPGVKDAPITSIEFEHADPDFAEHLLNTINRLTDNRVRTEALDRATRYAAYLSAKLRTTTLADHRIGLSEALRQQEESIMMASSGVPYAALPVEGPTAPNKPTNPKAGTILAAGLLAGLILGLAIAFIDPAEVRRRLSR